MTPLLAHQGGWDELLLSAALVFGMLWFSRHRRRRADGSGPPEPSSVCAYCGAPLERGAPRCRACGFRVAGA